MHLLFALALLLQPGNGAPKPAIVLVHDYAFTHKMELTERKDSAGYIWLEMDGSDIFGVGKTEALAADDFLHCADLIDHEPVDPAHAQDLNANCDPKKDCI